MLLRYIGLLLLTGVAGVLSGALWLLPNGLMGGVLGICLSAGTIWLGIKQRQQNGKLALGQALEIGFVVGLVAGILMALVSQALVDVLRRQDFGPPELPFWVPLVMGILYGIAIHWSYYQRRFSAKPLRQTLVYTCGICFLLKTAITFIYIFLTEDMHGEVFRGLWIGAMMSLAGAVPFAFLWVRVTASLDPAWSCPTWKPDEDKQTTTTPNV